MPPKKKAVARKKDDAVATTTPSPALPVDDISKRVDDSSEEHILLKLPISDEQLDSLLQEQDMSNVLQYVPIINDPLPYVPTNHFSNDADTLDAANQTFHCSTIDTCMTEFKNTCEKTNNHSKGCLRKKVCFWCCHEVGHMIFGMPIRYDFVNKSFTMFGTFCSLECAAAHNFSTHLGSDRAWEIHSWIQMLGKRYGYVEPIRPAPSRYLLNMFDGPLSIEDFRNAHKGQTRTYVLNIPPLISVNSQMEIVNTSYLGNEDERQSTEKTSRKASEKRKTLDSKMNLTIQ